MRANEAGDIAVSIPEIGLAADYCVENGSFEGWALLNPGEFTLPMDRTIRTILGSSCSSVHEQNATKVWGSIACLGVLADRSDKGEISSVKTR